VKLKAIENLAAVGIKVTLVTTIVNSWNNDGIGSIVKFAAENIDKVQTIAFQPFPLRAGTKTFLTPTALSSVTRSRA
jgi:Predicted Fe-S oxidoreductases